MSSGASSTSSRKGSSAPPASAATTAKILIRNELSRLIDADVFDSIEQYIESSNLTTLAGQKELSDFLKEFCGNTPESIRVINGFVSKYIACLNIPSSDTKATTSKAPQAFPKLDKSATSAAAALQSLSSTDQHDSLQNQTKVQPTGPAIGPALTGTKKGDVSGLSASSTAFVPAHSQFHVVEKKQSKKGQQQSPTTNNNTISNSKSNNNSSKASNSKRQGSELSEPVSSCGCFGTTHAFLTSCRACGRLHCEVEVTSTYHRCLHCGDELELPMSEEDVSNNGADLQTILAYRQKDRLLLFDKENAKRTHVYDAQSDYYENSVWLTEEERKILQEKEKEREDRHKTRGMTMQISFDVAGRRIVHHDSKSQEPKPSSNGSEIHSQRESSNSNTNSASSTNKVVPNSITPNNFTNGKSSPRVFGAPSQESRPSGALLSHQELASEETKVGFLFRKMMDSFKDDANAEKKP